MLWLIGLIVGCWLLVALVGLYFDDYLDKPSDPLKARMPYYDYD